MPEQEFMILPVVEDNDTLIAGEFMSSSIDLKGGREYKRGELLMSFGDNVFEAASPNAVYEAEELCLYYDVRENYPCAFFEGEFYADSVILPFEEENDSHDECITKLMPLLRKHRLYILKKGD